MRIKKSIIPIVLLAFAFAACGKFKNKELDTTKDIRIVSLSKHLTEMLFALGKGHDIVASDLTSSYPDSAKLLPKVGYHRALNAEGIISMKPDIVIHSNDIGPLTVIPQLEKVGLQLKTFGAANTFDSAKILITDLGKYFGADKQADSIVKKMDADMQAVIAAQKNIKDTPTVMIIHYGQANNNYFVMSGRNGPGDKMIVAAGGKPAKYDAKSAKQISAEAVALANPDIIIATDFGFDKMGSAEKFKTIPGVGLTNAAKNNRIYRFEEHDLVYFGLRSADNILKLMQFIHPTSDAKNK
jgi:iron complex transport system substrate-binding protein